MVGGDPTPGLFSNPQYLGMRSTYPTRFPEPVTGLTIGKFKPTASGQIEIAPGYAGDAAIAAMAGREKVPAPIRKAVEKVQAAGGMVRGQALRDSDGYYLGYRLHFPDGQMCDVTGAASRFPPWDVPFSRQDRQYMRQMAESNAPGESGNFSGGYAPSAEQAARYRRWRDRGGGR